MWHMLELLELVALLEHVHHCALILRHNVSGPYIGLRVRGASNSSRAYLEQIQIVRRTEQRHDERISAL
jgi:hypothetical protein